MSVPKPAKPDGILTPGLGWRPMRTGDTTTSWQAWWVATAPGFMPRTERLWPPANAMEPPSDPTDEEWREIATLCRLRHEEQLEWKAGTDSRPPIYDGTLGTLFRIYQTDADSPAQNWRWRTRVNQTGNFAILEHIVGKRMVRDLTFRDFKRWAEEWRAPAYPGGPERHSRAGAFMALVKASIAFGAALELRGCARVHALVAGRKAGGTGVLRIEGARRRTEIMTAAQVIAFRAEAHRQGWPSMALAQAIQFETSLRQGDVIGAWTPQSEPGLSDVVHNGRKWTGGLHWRDVSAELVLTKQISKSIHGRRNVGRPEAGKTERYDLKAYPMVVEELRYAMGANRHGAENEDHSLVGCDGRGSGKNQELENGDWLLAHGRGVLGVGRSSSSKVRHSADALATATGATYYPTYVASQAGPIIICERTGMPWQYEFFRSTWRRIARAAGIPDSVQNRDARAGGITEGEQAGATREQLRVHAAHSNAAMTDSYDRGGIVTRTMVAGLRAKNRKGGVRTT